MTIPFVERIDPELRPYLDALPPLDLSGDLARTRAAVAAARQPLLDALPEVPDVVSDDVEVAGLDGSTRVPVRVYRPRDAGPSGAALSFIHGGGMVFGSVAETDYLCRRIVHNIGCVVTSVEYRLAPEHPYPAPLDDCDAALRWLGANASDLGVDPARIAVGGISAGGGLAAGLALRARDSHPVELCFQWLIYPMIDDRNETPSSHEITEPRVWHRAANLRGWEAYLGSRWRTDDVPPEAAPARAAADELRGLPPAYLDVGELDPFRDEDIAYATALLQAGVPTELHVTPGAWHASETVAPLVDNSRRILRLRMQALARALS